MVLVFSNNFSKILSLKIVILYSTWAFTLLDVVICTIVAPSIIFASTREVVLALYYHITPGSLRSQILYTFVACHIRKWMEGMHYSCVLRNLKDHYCVSDRQRIVTSKDSSLPSMKQLSAFLWMLK